MNVFAICLAGLFPLAASAAVKTKFTDTQGKEVGQATLTPAAKGVRLSVSVRGLPPGPHGFHVHEKGECVGPTFDSAGSHFNPTGAQHGLHAPGGHHLGDLQDLVVKPDGSARVRVKIEGVSLGKDSLRRAGGTALVIHERPDDQRTQPSGNSGPRIACAVIPAL